MQLQLLGLEGRCLLELHAPVDKLTGSQLEGRAMLPAWPDKAPLQKHSQEGARYVKNFVSSLEKGHEPICRDWLPT